MVEYRKGKERLQDKREKEKEKEKIAEETLQRKCLKIFELTWSDLQSSFRCRNGTAIESPLQGLGCRSLMLDYACYLKVVRLRRLLT